jgi:16S rRNA (adenine1518-N6/adenine1519-N6)-dimethyltransferase
VSPARKRFGQHFLHDPAVLERIVAAIAPRPGEALVEIGPGRGALTQRLLGALAPRATLDAIEIDRDLAAPLKARYAATAAFTLHACDALEFDFSALARARGAALRVVGNLPYNISTPLLFHLLGQHAVMTDLHVMLQREVVERMAAAPGSRAFGRLTVMLAPWVSVERLFDIGPGAFSPPPKVWSALARLTVHQTPRFAMSPSFGPLVAAAFSQRRKTLRNAIAQFLGAERIAACGVDPGARAGTLAAADFAALARAADRL